MSGVTLNYKYAPIPEDLVYDHRLSPLDVRVWACIARHGFEQERCFPSHERIGALVDCSTRSVRRSVENLKTCGWLTYTRSMRQDGGWGVCHYKLETDTPIGHTRPVPPDTGGQTHRTEVAADREPVNESHLPMALEPEMEAQVLPITTPTKREVQKQELEAEFEEWWGGIWRKERKQGARKHYLRLRSKGLAERDHMFAQRDAYARLMRSQGREQQHTRMPANWLADGEWEEEVDDRRPSERPEYFEGPGMTFG